MTEFLKRFAKRLYDFARAEPVLIGAAILCAWIVSGLVEVADDVMEGDTHEIDTKLLLMLREPGAPESPLGPAWVEEMMRDFTGLGGIAILTLVTVAAGFYLLAIKKYARAFYLWGAVATGTVLSNLLKHGFDRPRPDLVPHGSYTYTASFPSGHAMMAAVVYLTLGVLLAEAAGKKRLKIYFLGVAALVTILVGFSRVYLGVHWPSDVLAGWLSGAAWAIAFWIIARLLARRGQIEPPAA